MVRLLNTRNVREKVFAKFEGLTDLWGTVLGEPDKQGCWLIYGKEKNGKTWFTVLLAAYFSNFERTMYISAEEGISSHYQDVLNQVNDDLPNMYHSDYLPIDELKQVLKRRYAPKIVIFDNLTFYKDELNSRAVQKLHKEFPNVLFIYLAHEDKNQPYLAIGKFVEKAAKIIFHVEGLRAHVKGRCPGGHIDIDTEKAELFHGTAEIQE